MVEFTEALSFSLQDVFLLLELSSFISFTISSFGIDSWEDLRVFERRTDLGSLSRIRILFGPFGVKKVKSGLPLYFGVKGWEDLKTGG